MKTQFTETNPFYTWSCDKNSNEIGKFLSGQRVVLTADVRAVGKNAVKFNRIDINITSRSMETNLQKILEDNFKIRLIHSGNSFFRYNNSYYSASNDKSFLLVFSFKKDSKGVPVVRNKVYNKMTSGQLLLSPYTSWIIQLEPLVDKRSSTVNQMLANFCDYEIRLVGEGSYVRVDLVKHDLKLDQYYRKVDITI